MAGSSNTLCQDYGLVFVYLYNILIFFGPLHKNSRHVQKVICCLLVSHLFIKPNKCEFCIPTVYFLGFIFSSGNNQKDTKKVWSICNWPTTFSVKDIQFLGFAHFYYKFVHNVGCVAASLTYLTKKVSNSRFFDWF